MTKKVDFAITVYFRVKNTSESAREWFDLEDFYEETELLADFDDDYSEEEEFGTFVLNGICKAVNIEKILLFFSSYSKYIESIVIDWHSASVPLKVAIDFKTIAEFEDDQLLTVFGESCGRFRHNSDTEEYYKFMSPEEFMNRRAAFNIDSL